MDKNIYIPAERHLKILEYIEQHKSAQIRELAAAFKVSEATIRRDLDDLDNSGALKRTHGGAVVNSSSTSYERIHSEKMSMMTDEKRRIAARCVQMVKDGDSIILDSGTTTLAIAQMLCDFKHLTVITNDLYIAGMTKLDDTSTMLCTGGVRLGGYQMLTGSETEEMIRNTRVNLAFVGADGVDLSFGVMNANYLEIEIKRLMVRAGMRSVLVCDHSKFGVSTLARFCKVNDFSCVVTDDGICEQTAKEINDMNVELICV